MPQAQVLLQEHFAAVAADERHVALRAAECRRCFGLLELRANKREPEWKWER